MWTFAPGVGRPRGRVSVGTRKMAAPVHRFASMDCPPRRPHRTQRHQPQSAPLQTRRQNDESSLYVEIPADPPQPTIASLAAARSVTPDTLLRTAALGLHHNTPLMAPHLKFGILVSFALATIFLAGAKYYFEKPVIRDNASGGEATVVCAAVACACGVGCALSMCRSKPAPLHVPDRVTSTARREVHWQQPPPQQPPAEEISLSSILQNTSQPSTSTPTPEAPPPYHIAVLLPQRATSPPPPAYGQIS